MTEISDEELDARLAAIEQGPWSKVILKARRKMAPHDRISFGKRGSIPIALNQLRLSPPNRRKSYELSKALKVPYGGHEVKNEEEISTREVLNRALLIPQLYELAAQTGYLPVKSITRPARRILADLLWSSPSRRFVEAHSYIAIPMLAARVGVSGFVSKKASELEPNTALRFAGFLAHLRAFWRDDVIDTWLAFLDDSGENGAEQNLLLGFLQGQRRIPPRRVEKLLAGCQRFVTSLASAFYVLGDEEVGQYGLIHAYWLQKFFGFAPDANGTFVKNVRASGKVGSWARDFCTSPNLVPEDLDLAVGRILHQQFVDDVSLLERAFEAVKCIAMENSTVDPPVNLH